MTSVKTAQNSDKLFDHVDQEGLAHKAAAHLILPGTQYEKDIIVRASGIYIYTADGRRIADWTSGQTASLLGHGHPEIAATMANRAATLDHTFSSMLTPPAVLLAEKLTSVLPQGLEKALFFSTGGESVEAAIKMAKVVTGNFEIVALNASWHGLTAQSLSAQYHHGRRGQGPMMPGMHMLPQPNAYRSKFRKPNGSYDWEAELDYGWALIDAASCGSLAACVVECIQSAGGIHVLPPGYLQAMKRHCERRGMLLIADEAQTLARTGSMTACEYEGVTPDIMALSKTLGTCMPLSAIATTDAIADMSAKKGFFFLTTHLNDPIPCAVGLKVLEIIERDHLVGNARERGEQLLDGLRKLQSRYGCIGDVRGRGLKVGMELVQDRETKEPAFAIGAEVGRKASQLGLWANLASHPAFGGIFRLCPPITITATEIQDGLDVLEEAFATTSGTLPLY